MLRYLPWKFIVQRVSRAYGFADPALWMARIRSFAQPSEVAEPIELLRAGMLFHARGLVNTKAIQHNLDWVWPYWVERQFDPEDVSFIPRAFSISHVNLTHRNWTAVGLPALSVYPLVDPRGLVTPALDGWSLDFWLLGSNRQALLPSRLHEEFARQDLNTEDNLRVVSSFRIQDLALRQTAAVELDGDEPILSLELEAFSASGGALVVAVRPYNPEGIQFIDRIAQREQRDGWQINDRLQVLFDRPADQLLASDYTAGDVFRLLSEPAESLDDAATAPDMRCKVGMATAAAVFRFTGERTQVQVKVPLRKELAAVGNEKTFDPKVTWGSVRSQMATLSVPDQRLMSLYEAAVHTLILLSADEFVPGPYTYRRFWFRDACLMMHALLAIGAVGRCLRAIERFPQRQLRSGYFRSQEGEWDSNGQVLWILDRYESMAGKSLGTEWVGTVGKAVDWIERKRVRACGGLPHEGLLPAGFSAEHLGPNDYYYWDVFWSEAGLRGAASLYRRHGRLREAQDATAKANDLRQAIDRSIASIPRRSSLGGIPASPYRRLDAGAIGSLVADYPLQLFPPAAPAIMTTVEHLMRRCFFKGGFFQEVIHSGINAYLTLDIAQTLLRAGDARYRELMQAVAALASPTGQWPEAIHPRTGGGCMGDGQHGWAAAEWVMMIRNCFVREEGNRLIVGGGLFPEWLDAGSALHFGPAQTPFGRVTVHLAGGESPRTLMIDGQWHGAPPRVDVEAPGYGRLQDVDCSRPILLEPIHEDDRAMLPVAKGELL